MVEDHVRVYRCVLTLLVAIVAQSAATVSAQDHSAAPERLEKLAQRFTSEDAKSTPPVTFDETRPLGSIIHDRTGADIDPSSAASGGESGWILQMITALGVVIGLIFLARAVIARVGGKTRMPAAPGLIQVLGRTAIAPRCHVVLVKVGHRFLVLGESAAGLATLATLDKPDEITDILKKTASAAPNSISGNFGQLLQRFNRRLDEPADPFEQGAGDNEFQADRARDEIDGLLGRIKTFARGVSGDAGTSRGGGKA